VSKKLAVRTAQWKNRRLFFALHKNKKPNYLIPGNPAIFSSPLRRPLAFRPRLTAGLAFSAYDGTIAQFGKYVKVF
jgi:hypothetical protein